MKNIKNFIIAYKQNPIDLFTELLNQSSYKYLYLIVGILGLSKSFNGIFDNIYLFDGRYDQLTLLYYFIKTIIITSISIYIYSWIVIFTNSLFKGYCRQKDILAVIVYSLIPWIFGSFIVLALKFVLYTFTEFADNYLIIYSALFFISLVFYIWSLIYLIIGNAIVNNFVIIKSIVASALLPLIITVYQIINFLKLFSR